MDLKQLDFVLGIGNFIDSLVVVDENCRICSHRIFQSGGVNWEEQDSIGKTPMEAFPGLTEANCPTYRALHFGEKKINEKLKINFKDLEFLVVVNTMLVTRHGKTIGAASAGQVLDAGLLRDTITLPGPAARPKRHLFDVTDIIGNSRETQLLRMKIKRVAVSPSNVLIYGETGTGKELVAQSIHSNSLRPDAPFISQNCAAIPENLLESTFFGTTRGSFTGAENRPGIFELAEGGTLFLDELNSMDLGMQAKLLKAIEEKRITRVGGDRARQIDVRILSSINETPDRCLQDKTIRADLFYRLSGVQIRLPPLRERQSDLADLLPHYLNCLNQDLDKAIQGVSQDVQVLFEHYDWPGNIREFKHVLECAVSFGASPVLQLDDLPEYMKKINQAPRQTQLADGESLSEAMDRFERDFIKARAKEARSLAELAGRLKISRQTLKYKMRKHGLDPFED
ncbi:MAG: sigma 54-interacting transcriptional regulator [Holophaga sp.]|nr:sigma 54-interacting transcriptional regulator [Holophaga sp.]